MRERERVVIKCKPRCCVTNLFCLTVTHQAEDRLFNKLCYSNTDPSHGKSHTHTTRGVVSNSFRFLLNNSLSTQLQRHSAPNGSMLVSGTGPILYSFTRSDTGGRHMTQAWSTPPTEELHKYLQQSQKSAP